MLTGTPDLWALLMTSSVIMKSLTRVNWLYVMLESCPSSDITCRAASLFSGVVGGDQMVEVLLHLLPVLLSSLLFVGFKPLPHPALHLLHRLLGGFDVAGGFRQDVCAEMTQTIQVRLDGAWLVLPVCVLLKKIISNVILFH